MRLIDADEFYERMKNDTDLCAEMEKDGLEALKKYLDLQPTTYDIDKVVAEIEKKSNDDSCAGCCTIWGQDAIEIVKQGGVSDDVCEWELFTDSMNEKYINTSCGKYVTEEITNGFKYCPYCSKKIKAVE